MKTSVFGVPTSAVESMKRSLKRYRYAANRAASRATKYEYQLRAEGRRQAYETAIRMVEKLQ